jgi:hypothetical protein
MPTFVPHVLIGVGITLAIWLLSADGWPGLVIGAVLAATLWVMLRVGPVREGEDAALPALDYLATGVVAVALGYVFYRIGDENGVWWSVGFILAGLVLPARNVLGRASSAG